MKRNGLRSSKWVARLIFIVVIFDGVFDPGGHNTARSAYGGNQLIRRIEKSLTLRRSNTEGRE